MRDEGRGTRESYERRSDEQHRPRNRNQEEQRVRAAFPSSLVPRPSSLPHRAFSDLATNPIPPANSASIISVLKSDVGRKKISRFVMMPARMMTAPVKVSSHPMTERPLKKRNAIPAMSGISVRPNEL